MKYKINPFPAVRVNWKGGRFTDRATNYHNKMNDLRDLIWSDKEKIIQAMLVYGYHSYSIMFHIPMPESWSKKKKEKMCFKPHQSTPDLDNLYKAFTDTIFYVSKKEWKAKYNDSSISFINCHKIRNNEWMIEFTSPIT